MKQSYFYQAGMAATVNPIIKLSEIHGHLQSSDISSYFSEELIQDDCNSCLFLIFSGLHVYIDRHGSCFREAIMLYYAYHRARNFCSFFHQGFLSLFVIDVIPVLAVLSKIHSAVCPLRICFCSSSSQVLLSLI